jgi:hypothetical protein
VLCVCLCLCLCLCLCHTGNHNHNNQLCPDFCNLLAPAFVTYRPPKKGAHERPCRLFASSSPVRLLLPRQQPCARKLVVRARDALLMCLSATERKKRERQVVVSANGDVMWNDKIVISLADCDKKISAGQQLLADRATRKKFNKSKKSKA